MSVSFFIAHEDQNIQILKESLHHVEAGGFCSFEGWVRNHNEGRSVHCLDYEVYEALALTEGRAILQEAKERFAISGVAAMHRAGQLSVGEMAVWVGVAAPHRQAAFKACQYVIDEIKKRLPVWKKEHYDDGEARWVACHHHDVS